MSDQEYCRLVYASRSHLDPAAGAIEDQILGILEVSQANNKRDGVGGLLWYSGGYFCQVLEGELDCVRSTYERIKSDPRHEQCTMLFVKAIERRRYPGMPMGLVAIDESPHPHFQAMIDDPVHEGFTMEGRAFIDLLESRIDEHTLRYPMTARSQQVVRDLSEVRPEPPSGNPNDALDSYPAA